MKDLLSKKTKKRIKKSLSIILAVALFMEMFVMPGNNSLNGIFNVPTIVYAADDPEYIHDGSNNITVDISQLVAYSQAYQNYPEYHQYDNITIGATSSSNYYLNGFAGIGTDAYPFKGSISLDTNFNAGFNLNKPLFNAVCDTVQINGGNEILISRKYQGTSYETMPIFATKVVSGDSGVAKASWSITIVPNKLEGNDIMLAGFGGIIGEIGEGATVNVSATMNVDNAETYSDKTIAITGSSDIGLICGKIGANATLNCTMNGDRMVSSVSTTSGNAGGLVGTMGTGSVFNYTQTAKTDSFIEDSANISTSTGDYAGGLIGQNNGGTFTLTMPQTTIQVESEEETTSYTDTAMYPVRQTINAKTGSGGIYGYYKPAADDTINTGLYSIECVVNGNGSCGGLIGKLETSYNVTISRKTQFPSKDIVLTHSSGWGDNSNIGGFIGSIVSTNTPEILVNGVSANITKSEGGTYYGGAVGLITGKSYIGFDDFTLTDANNCSLTFGGLVGKCDKTFVNVGDVDIDVTGKIKGGGLVGDIGDGVIRMTGNVNLEGAESEVPEADNNSEYKNMGQIVGFRDDALIFMEKDCTLTRSTNVPEVDDIGTWGEILRFSNTTETDGIYTNYMGESSVLTVNGSTHAITIGASTLSIGSPADFAKTSLCFQIDTDNTNGNPFASFAEGNVYTYDTINQSGIEINLSDSIDLTGTGLLGLTRDNDTSDDGDITSAKCVFKGTFDGDNKTLTLAIGDDSTGFNGKIYRHKYSGLFAVIDGGIVKNVTFAGNIRVKSRRQFMYAGAAAAVSTGTFTATGITGNTVFTLSDNGDNGNTKYYFNVGRLLGAVSSTGGNVSISSSTFNGNMNAACTEDYFRAGGVIGVVAQKGAINISFDTVSTTGEIKNTSSKGSQRLSGLISEVDDASDNTVSRKITLKTVKADGLKINGSNSDKGSIGGMLGYRWSRIDAELDGVTVGENTQASVISDGTNNNASGLVYQATGYWNVKSITFTNFKASCGSGASFGMLVNDGRDGSNRIYMDLRDGHTYAITSATFDKAYTYFDELVTYTWKDDAMNNGQGIISVHIANSTNGGLVMNGSTASGTYQAQTSEGRSANPNSRYYYNLDTVTGTTSEAVAFTGTNADVNKLMSWSVNKYAADNIKKYFYANFSSDGFDSTHMGKVDTTYDLEGYSWYPLNVGGITVNGTYKLYNKEFEGSEGQNTYKRTSLYNTTEKCYTQHKLMQNALFYKVNGKLTVGKVALDGTVSVAKSGEGSGALVFNTITGNSSNSIKFDVTTSITLDGIKVDYGTETYAPLLINNVGSNIELNVSHVYLTSGKYSNASTSKAATSLIGKVGSTSAEQLKVVFTDIGLDGRSGTTPSLDGVYGTESSIFSRATLIEQFAYKDNSGSYGRYTFSHGEDWDETDNNKTTRMGRVTYGSEISDSTSRKEYYGQEFWYNNTTHDNSGSYVNPEGYDNPSTKPYNFSGFLPYVWKTYGSGYHQLEVNHDAATFGGCGTYNDPYTITEGSQLVTIAKIIDGSASLSSDYKILIDSVDNDKWCDSVNEHVEYYYNNGDFTPTSGSGDNLSMAYVREYLSNAYYSFETDNMEIPDGFPGLGAVSDSKYVFKGIIVGNGNKIINKSDYPLIYASNGSAVYNLNIEVDKAITLNQGDRATFASNSGCQAYGAVIGRVMGGDNIIDHVQVSYGENASFDLTGTCANTIPLGGYVGVVIKGGLIFRGMEEESAYYRGTANITGLNRLDASKITNDSATTTITETVTNDDETTTTYTYNAVSSDNKKWLYINPIIGRVLNGYAITEASAYRPFEDGIRTYPDDSKDYCIVSDGGVSFVDDEHYDSSTNTLAPVTMQNGTKNYSIADIDTSLADFTMDGYTTGANVGVSNAQSLYIISLITQTGLGTSNNGKYEDTKNILNPYTDYMATHVGSYRYVGLSTLNDADPPTDPGENGSAGQKDYAKIVTATTGDRSDKTNASKVPYLIQTYTPYLNATNPYPAFDLNGYTADGKGNEIYLNMSFTGDDTTFYLPDGFRGLGALMYGQSQWWSGAKNNKNIRIYHGMFINSLNGNNKNISLNMSLLLYSNDYENYLTTTGSQNHLKAGFGFFDVLRSNYTESNGNKIKDFSIKGNIKYDIINKESGNHTTYNDNSTYGLNTNAKPAIGGLAGAPGADTEEDGGGGSIYLENIKLDNLSVYGMRAAGGMFGCTNATSKYYYMGCSADNLRVTGVAAGGMIGYVRHGSSQFEMDFNDKEFNIISIECLSLWNPGNEGAASAGGLIGHNYANKNLAKNSNNESIVIRNVNINNASSFSKGYIGYSTSENNSTVPAAGGVIGTCTRNSFVRIENVSVNNIDMCGNDGAGIIGYTNGRAKIYQCKVTATESCVIESKNDSDNASSSGFIGRADMNDDTYYGVYLNDCELNGYNIKGYRNQAGIVGKTVGGKLYNISIDNVKISDIAFNSNSYCGSLVGRYNDGIIGGYNILCKDITFDRYTPDSKKTVPDNYGYIIGQLNTPATRYVKLSGFSRQGDTNREQMVGNKTDTASDRYGTKGYVAFADYNGAALSTATQGKKQSGVKATDAEDNVSETRTNDNWPYVSTSPFKNLDSSGTPGFLTGDGTNVQIFNAIISDTSSTKKYSAARSAIEAESTVTTTAGKTAYYNSQMSLITGELSDSYIEFENHTGIERFPLLLIEDTNPTNTTNLINNYLRTLTNTGYTFSNKTIDYTNQYGYGFDYDIDLIKMRFNGTTFEPGADGSACLKWDGTGSQAKFRMYANDIDSGSTAQFSLIDLKFYDPLNRPAYNASQVKTSEGIVAYHVYVPVFVKKMRRFNFTAKIDSGTDYFISHYTNAMKNGTLFENLGNPITIEMEYNYDRTASEWKDAINGGDSTLTNYYKRIAIKSHVSAHTWPADTTLVLVDASNNDKFYYLDDPATKITFGDDGIGYMDLWDFVDDSGEHYKPVDFYDLLENVVISPNAEGTLTTVGATSDNAVVKTTDGDTVTYYTTIPANIEIAEADRYTVSSVGGVNNETYYLSIFTKNQNIERIFRYEIYSVDSNLQSVEGKWSIPDAQWSPNKIKEEGTAQLFTGKLYTNTLKTLVTDTDDHEQLMGEGGNLKINVEMTSTVALTDSAINNGIQSNLRTATNAHIYQTFMVSMDMKEEEDSDSFIGIKSKPTKSSKISTQYWYSIGGTFDDANKVLVSSPTVEDSSSSFIELRNGQELRTLLANNQAVSFKISYDLLYSLDQILPQFPKGIFDSSDQLLNGTKVVGYSGVGASIDGAAYSSNVDTLTENKYYYSASSSVATLKYNTDEEPYSDYDEDTMQSAYNYKAGPYSMLGINPTEEEGYMYVSSYAVYNPSMLIDAPDYIQMRLTLRKRSNYNELLNIATYISDMKIYGNSVDAEGNAVPIFSQVTDANSMTTTYTVTVPKSSLQKKTNTEEYIIPITFKVKTGEEFETAGLQYSNYMVNLEVDMRETQNSASAVLYSLGTDHIIYTNARVVPEVIEPQ